MFWTQGAKVSQKSFAPPKPCFAPVQLSFAPVQEVFNALGPKDLLHPLLTTFGNFHSQALSQDLWVASQGHHFVSFRCIGEGFFLGRGGGDGF